MKQAIHKTVNSIGGEEAKHVTHPTLFKGKLVALPFAALVALMIASVFPANAKVSPNDPTLTEWAVSNDAEKVDQKTQTKPTDVDPSNIASLSAYKIQDVTRFKIDGKDYNMIFATIKAEGNSKVVRNVYFAPCDFDGYARIGNEKVKQRPAWALNLVYHDLGDDSKSFCGVAVEKHIPNIDANDKLSYKTVNEELRLPDELGQKIMDLIGNATQWENRTTIGFVETNSPTLLTFK